MGCSSKRLWEEKFKEMGIYQIKWQRFMKLGRRSSGLRMITGRKIERFIIWRQEGLLRIEEKAICIDYSLFCVCSEARTVYHNYYIHKYSTSEKSQDLIQKKIMEATGKVSISEGRLGKSTS